MNTFCLIRLAVSFTVGWIAVRAAEDVRGRRSLVLRSDTAQITMDLAGGAIGEFRLKSSDLNPLNWGTPKEGDSSTRGFGHFLCLDRWGPPTDVEGRNGMPYHGEAPNVVWQEGAPSGADAHFVTASSTARLPLAGLSVQRLIKLAKSSAYGLVREEVRNENKLGRVFNMVQHPTIAAPFLTEATLVDCNGRKGFAQGNALPHPEEPSFYWPQALNRDGRTVNLRHLTDDPNPNVVSYAIDGEWGWITAASFTPLGSTTKSLLIGYLWRTRDYPWVSVWRDVQGGKPSARGLEFGTTGLHQPFPILTAQGKIFGRQLLEHLDAGESRTKSYAIFLAEIPRPFAGVGSLEVQGNRIILHERDRDDKGTLVIEAPELP